MKEYGAGAVAPAAVPVKLKKRYFFQTAIDKEIFVGYNITEITVITTE